MAFNIPGLENLTAEKVGQTVSSLVNQFGATEEEASQLTAALIYEQAEQQGRNLNDFWEGIDDKTKAQLKLNPKTLLQVIGFDTYIGTAITLFWILALLSGGTLLIRGIPIALKTIKLVKEALAAGKTAQEIFNIFSLGRLISLTKVGVPALLTTIFVGLGFGASTVLNTLGDPLFWGRVNINQAEKSARDDLLRGFKELSAPSVRAAEPKKKTVLRMAETSKPQVATGVLFSASLSKPEAFERHVDDEITDAEDLKNDAKLNFNSWLKGLKGRISYSVAISNNPFDEFGNRQSGFWVTMTVLLQRVAGAKVPIDTILLGPIKPQKYMPTSQQVKTLETELTGELEIEAVQEITVPSGDLKLVDKAGNIVPLTFAPPTVAPAIPTEPAVGFGQGDKFAVLTINGVNYQKGPFFNSADVDNWINWAVAQYRAGGLQVSNVGASSNRNLPSAPPPPAPIAPAAAATPPTQPKSGFPRSVTVNVPVLNVRSQPTSQSATAGSKQLKQGETFQVTGAVTGESVAGENRWWVSQFGNYVWVGGTAEKP